MRLGGTINQHLLIGSQVDAWTKTEHGATATFGNVTAAAYYDPIATEGLYVMGGVGIASRRLVFGDSSQDGDGGRGALRVGVHVAVAQRAVARR